MPKITYNTTRLADTRLIPIPPATELIRNSLSILSSEKSCRSSPLSMPLVPPSILRKSLPAIHPPTDSPGNDSFKDGHKACQSFDANSSVKKSRVSNLLATRVMINSIHVRNGPPLSSLKFSQNYHRAVHTFKDWLNTTVFSPSIDAWTSICNRIIHLLPLKKRASSNLRRKSILRMCKIYKVLCQVIATHAPFYMFHLFCANLFR